MEKSEIGVYRKKSGGAKGRTNFQVRQKEKIFTQSLEYVLMNSIVHIPGGKCIPCNILKIPMKSELKQEAYNLYFNSINNVNYSYYTLDNIECLY